MSEPCREAGHEGCDIQVNDLIEYETSKGLRRGVVAEIAEDEDGRFFRVVSASPIRRFFWFLRRRSGEER